MVRPGCFLLWSSREFFLFFLSPYFPRYTFPQPQRNLGETWEDFVYHSPEKFEEACSQWSRCLFTLFWGNPRRNDLLCDKLERGSPVHWFRVPSSTFTQSFCIFGPFGIKEYCRRLVMFRTKVMTGSDETLCNWQAVKHTAHSAHQSTPPSRPQIVNYPFARFEAIHWTRRFTYFN